MNEQQHSKWAILFVTVMFPFMGTLDMNIVNIALPSMAATLGVTSSQIAWVVSAYLVTLTASILFFGRLGDLKGQTRVFKVGMIVFTGGSLLCGISPNFEALVAARVVQALGASAVMANNQAIISRAFSKEERGRALGINSAFVALGTLVGPALGGFLITLAGWQSLFWINVPVGILVCAGAWFVFPKEKIHTHEKMDVPGAALFALCMILLFSALQQGQTIGYNSPLIQTGFGFSILCFVGFIMLQKRSASPLLKLEIFKNKWFSASLFCAFASYSTIACYNMIMPFYLQGVRGMVPSSAGVYMTLYPLILVLAAPISGYVSDKIGAEGLTLLGLVLTGGGLFMLAGLKQQTGIGALCFMILVLALGSGLFQSPNTSLVMSSLPPDKLGVGGSTNALTRTIGQALGTAGSTALLYAGMSQKLGQHVTDFVRGQEEAFLYGMKLVFIGAGVISLCGVFITALRLYQRKIHVKD